MNGSKCNVVRDLLPLYHEKLTSCESNQIIESHLEACGECHNYSYDLDDHDDVIQQSGNVINKIRHTILADKRKSIFISIMISIVLVVLFIFSITAPNYIKYDADEVSISKISDSGYVLLSLDNDATGYEIYEIEENVYSLTTWTSILDQVMDKKPISSIVVNGELELVSSVVYSEYDSTESIEIYGSQFEHGGIFLLPRLVIGMYFTLAVILAVILFILNIITKEWIKINKFITILLSFTLIYIITTLFIKGFSSQSSYSPLREISQILILSIIIEIIYLKLSEWIKIGKRINGR